MTNTSKLQLDSIIIRFALLLLISMQIIQNLNASELVEITPLTNRIIMLHLDDGNMIYPNNLTVNRLNVNLASNEATYMITSVDDNEFTTGIQPVDIGRKSKGTEFVSNSGVPWGGSSFDPTSKPWASEHWLYIFLNQEMKPGKTYTLATGNLITNGQQWEFVFDEKEHRSEAVHVNTLGYSPGKPKFGYVYHWMGDKGNLSLANYSGNKFWIMRQEEAEPVMEGTIVFRAAANSPETGQPNDTPNQNFIGGEVYECDFSSVNAPGNYLLSVEGIGASYPFTIGEDAIFDAYYHGARTLYHQRSGIRLEPPYTEEGYIRPVTQNTKVTSDDGTDFSNLLLYCTLPWVEWAQGEGGGSSVDAIRAASIGNNLDVAGWYHDAGDWDGYFSHQRIPILLMLTYEAVPGRFMDGDLNIPESGNGIPDLIDEASWLIKFNYRLKKELINKGFSDGGVGGARVAPDFFSAIDGSAESNKPSWKDHRRYVITDADSYMTYLYAGQAAQLAYILKSVGKDAESYPVEMLDHVDFEQMTYDDVNWIQEAIDAFEWASDPENQPSMHAHYASELWVYKMYAAVSLFRLTGDATYHAIAIEELNKIKNSSNFAEDERYAAYLYLMTNHKDVDFNLQASLQSAALATASFRGTHAASLRGLRWGGDFSMPMLVGQGTTPWMFETIMAYAITQDDFYANVVHTTADYFLGNNPLHTTWMTGVGPRPAKGGFHLDTRYLWDNNWMVYKGFVPYGPWSMNYDYNPSTWTIDGVEMQGGAGPWNKDWANFSVYPLMSEWPGHERYNNNIHAPMSTENTVHQQSVYLATSYGFANNRQNANNTSPLPINSIELNQTEITFNQPGDQSILNPSIDLNNASFAALKWESADPRIAHVDGFGRVTAITGGTTTITCSTLDGSVLATCEIICNWEDTAVNSISITPEAITLFQGQTMQLTVTFDPPDATNLFVDWTYSTEGIAQVSETGLLTALDPGIIKVYATSMQDSRVDSVDVEVLERIDHVIADFDEVIPVTTTPQPDLAQIYFPEGAGNIEAPNPYSGAANESDLTLKWDRPEGNWRLMGMVLPTDYPQDLSQFDQFQFKYYGKEIENILVQLIPIDGSNIEITLPIEGENCWKLFTYDLNSSLLLKQFNVFVNTNVNPSAGEFFFDDFVLTAESAIPYNQLQINYPALDMSSGESFQLEANTGAAPYSWVSSNPEIATVGHNGLVTAVAGGITQIKAVALYGNTAVCEVTVDGGITEPDDSKIIIDFENIGLNWNPYGAYSFNSNVQGLADNPMVNEINSSATTYRWERDGTNNWGGFGLQFNQEETAEWDLLSFQFYTETQTLNGIRFVIRQGETELGEIELNDLNLSPLQWHTIEVPINSLVTDNASFNQILAQPHKASDIIDVVFFDNLMFKRLPFVAVESIEIEGEESIMLNQGQSMQLTATVTPENATNSAIVWTSANEDIATVSTTGLLTAVAAGNVVITAEAEENSDIFDNVSITVLSVNIAEMDNQKIAIYPVPTEGRFIVKSDFPIDRVDIYSITGERIISKRMNGEKESAFGQISDKPGIYFIRIILENGNVSTLRQVVINNL